MRRLQLTVLACCAVSLASGAAITSAANGYWDSTSSWTGGVVPGDGDTVTITHNITVRTNTTIGNSPADVIGSAPTLPVIALSRTKPGAATLCGDSETVVTNGTLTIDSGVTFTVKGSVSVTGTLYRCSPIITLLPGSTWTFDNSGAPSNGTGVYRIYGLQMRSVTQIIASGIGWGAGQFITINGRNPVTCPVAGDGTGGTCKNAVWTNELTTPVAGGQQDSIKHNYNYVKFYYFGSAEASEPYRSLYIKSASEGYTGWSPGMFMTNVEWHNSTGFGAGGSYPAANMDFKLENVKSVESLGNNGFFWVAPTTLAPVAGTVRTAKYLYFDTGSVQSGVGINFTNFQAVEYIVFDNQHKPYGPGSGSTPTNMPTNVNHILTRQTSDTAKDSTFFGDTNYTMWVVDGGVGNTHCDKTTGFSSGSHSWVIDHAIWQHGNGASTGGSSDTDPTTARPSTYNVGNFPTTFNYMLMLPNAAKPTATSHAWGVYMASTTSSFHLNHSVVAFGKDSAGTGGIIGTMYVGEGDNGIAGSIGIKNSILWNPNTTAYGSPLAIHTGNTENAIVANAFDPTQIHNNMVWNYDPAVSQRWTSAVTGCSGGAGGNCASYGTPYDYKMTTAPGANDLWGTPIGSFNLQNKPDFVWQKEGRTAPGPREWAHERFGADINTSSTPSGCTVGGTCTQVKFDTTFAVFANADISDTTTIAGLKGRIDDMFSWIYGKWASTNTVLKGAADDVGVATLDGKPNVAAGDIGAAPVSDSSSCPSAYPAGVLVGCNSIAQLAQPPLLFGTN